MGAEQIFHRPGPLKQTNKPHKTGRHRSKGSIDNALKGRISLKVVTHKHRQQQRREQRRNQMDQIRKNKRSEAIALKRKLGSQDSAPFLVCILPMHSQIDAQSLLSLLENCDEEAIVDRSAVGVTYINVARLKQRFAFIIPPVGRGNELVVLDYLKVSDTTLLLTSAAMGEDEVFDKWGHKIFNMISAQGIPTPIVGLMDLESINPKRRSQIKASVQKFISKLLPNEKVMQMDTNSEGLNVLRRIGGQKKNILQNQSIRPHFFGEKVEFQSNTESNTGTLEVSGFLRGNPLNVNGLVHIPGLGDFQMNKIECLPDPFKIDKRNTDMQEILVYAPNPQMQTCLQIENIPDPFDTEQTWPTEEEMDQSSNKESRKKLIKRIPKGWSEYQAAWIPDVEVIENENKSDDDDSSVNEDNLCESMSYQEENSDGEIVNNESDTEEFIETASVSEDVVNDEKYDLQIDLQEERETMKKIKDARADQMWPDEIDTPQDIPARDRFQKFRGLESFRTSPWDPKENLPRDYARIFQFQNFDRTRKRIISEAKKIEGVEPGSYVKIHIRNVTSTKWNAFKSAHSKQNVILYGLLPHEHQMSVVNVVLKRVPGSEVPIKSKEKLIIQCGYRRFVVNPVFSQHTNGSKHKFERYFHPNTTVVATFYAPIQFPSASVLCFKENPDTTLALVAQGSLLSCNPDRIILKRIALSGHPMRINRKSATIRYMFFNKEDVNYFKPVKLRTKCGRLGHIKESLGTHGHMKCNFDGQLKSYDTVFMYLYKRIFPKWTYEECLVSCEDTTEPMAD